MMMMKMKKKKNSNETSFRYKKKNKPVLLFFSEVAEMSTEFLSGNKKSNIFYDQADQQVSV